MSVRIDKPELLMSFPRDDVIPFGDAADALCIERKSLHQRLSRLHKSGSLKNGIVYRKKVVREIVGVSRAALDELKRRDTT